MGGKGSGITSRSRDAGATPCERLSRRLCSCPGCHLRRAVAVERVGPNFPALGAIVVQAEIEGV